MDIKDFIELLKKYDFVHNSVKSFCDHYKVNVKTTLKHLRQNGIRYNRKAVLNPPTRDVTGKFCLTFKKENHKNSVNKESKAHERNRFNSFNDKLKYLEQ